MIEIWKFKHIHVTCTYEWVQANTDKHVTRQKCYTAFTQNLGVFFSDTTRTSQTTYRSSKTNKKLFRRHRIDVLIYTYMYSVHARYKVSLVNCTLTSLTARDAHALIQVVLLIHRQQRQFAQNRSTFSSLDRWEQEHLRAVGERRQRSVHLLNGRVLCVQFDSLCFSGFLWCLAFCAVRLLFLLLQTYSQGYNTMHIILWCIQ